MTSARGDDTTTFSPLTGAARVLQRGPSVRMLFVVMLALLVALAPAAACSSGGGNQPNASGAPGY